MTITKADAEAIVAEPKVITQNLAWRQMRSRARRYRLDAAVLIPGRDELARLSASVNRDNFGFALLYANQPIRKAHIHFQHRNPDGEHITGPHKHTWDETFEDEWAYVPTEIDWTDANRALLTFLKECNIEFKGTYKPFMV